MSPRRPPRLANWLLNRSGVARRNPPLAGDLQEEFGRRRSAAWYWRQTLVAICTGFSRNVRVRRLTAAVIGWAAQAGVAFVLLRFRLLPQPTHLIRTISAGAIVMFLVVWLVFFRKTRKIKRPDTDKSLDPPVTESLTAGAVDAFCPLLLTYCVLAMVQGMTLEDFIMLQSVWFYSAVLSPARSGITRQ